MLFVDHQDREPHGVVVDTVEQAINSELADVGVPMRASGDLALLGGDALVGIDLLRLALDHTHQGRQADLADGRSGHLDLLGLGPVPIALFDLGDDLQGDVGQGPRRAF
jgi:hypothetical protein